MSKHQIQPHSGWRKQADVGWDGRTRLAREAKFSGADGYREKTIFPFTADHEQD